MNSNGNYTYKIIIVGDSSVGKTSLMRNYIRGVPAQNERETIGIDMGVKEVIHNGELIKLQFWDTAGQDRYRTITSVYYRGSHGCVIVFDLSNLTTLQHVITWAKDMKTHVFSTIPVILVGNKSDLGVEVNRLELERIMNELSHNKIDIITYIETSAVSGQNVESVFTNLVRVIYNGIMEKYKRETDEEVKKIEIVGTKNKTTTSCTC